VISVFQWNVVLRSLKLYISNKQAWIV